MHLVLRLLIASVAAMAAGAASFLLVGFTIMNVFRPSDIGAGGGLLMLAAGLLATTVVGVVVYRALPRSRD